MSFKNIFFFSLLSLFISQSVHSQQNLHENKIADKYFLEKKYDKTKEVINKMIRQKMPIHKNSLLKMAYIYENEKDFSRALFFLNLYFERNPSEMALTKMNNIATSNNIEGYELSDFYLLLLLVKQYSFVIFIFFVFLGIYILSIFLIKKTKKQAISINQKIVFFLYLSSLILLLNIPNFYKQAIVNTPNATLRNDPSSASTVAIQIQNGHRLNIIGSEDIWLRVFYGSKFYYINKANVWLVN